MTADPLDALRLPIVPVQPRPEFAANLLGRLIDPQRVREEAGDDPEGRDTVAGARDPAGVSATVRYFVADLDTAVAFYRDELGFSVELRPSPAFAMLHLGNLRLLLSVPSAAHALPDGTLPDPGGWNRILIEVTDLGAAVMALRNRGVRIRREIAAGVGVRQALVDDPSGNPVELFQPTTDRPS
ncbi:MAG TPA: VOC family protein [Streptosporangiaceae bacterium]|jgi:catechol 2,3-dioxygenase-like lactoylglutathione lyase family enzyme